MSTGCPLFGHNPEFIGPMTTRHAQGTDELDGVATCLLSGQSAGVGGAVGDDVEHGPNRPTGHGWRGV